MSERADVWDARRVRARKRHTCDGCREPICVGTVHDRIGCLTDGSWCTLRVHLECHELARELTDPDEGTYFVHDLLEQVRERVYDYGDTGLVRRWLGLRRARLREQRGRAYLCVDAPARAEEARWPVGERCEADWRARDCEVRVGVYLGWRSELWCLRG